MMNKRIVLLIVISISFTSFYTASLLADPPKNKGKPDKANNVDSSVSASLSVMVNAGISVGDARKLASEYNLTGGKPLPPGIRKNLARGKPMPPGIQKTRMPESFINQLPVHEGFEWQEAGTDLLLVAVGSLIISDILEGVFD